MRVAAFGRSKRFLECINNVLENGHEISLILTDAHFSNDENYLEDFFEFAKIHHIEIYVTNNLSDVHIVQSILKSNSRIAISANWKTMVPEQIIEIFPLGVLNAHSGDLPKYKGNAAVNWAILNGEKEIALTIHKMTSRLDEGPIMVKKYFKIDDSIYFEHVREFIELNLPIAFLEAINLLNRDPYFEINKTDNLEETRGFSRLPQDGHIDWNKSTHHIHKLIRASGYPFQGAYTFHKNNKVVILRARKEFPEYTFYGVPGQIASRNSKVGEVKVITADGLIVLEKIRVNKVNYKPSEFLMTVKDRLGLNLEAIFNKLKN
tara:strand:+ start:4358 stop:5317 length:960 start_codon:yes stop_codon:yes gene_type:complete